MLRRLCANPLCFQVTSTLILLLAYLGVGLLFYIHVETKECSAPPTLADSDVLAGADYTYLSYGEAREATGDAGSGGGAPCPVVAAAVNTASNCTEPWSVVDAIYFSMVTMSTVGYGDFSPSTWYSQIFTIFYIFIGIVAVFTQLSSAMMIVFMPLFDLTKKVTTFMLPGEDPLDVDGDGTYDFVMPQAAWIYYTKNMFGPMSIVILVQVRFAPISLRSPRRSRADLALTSLRSTPPPPPPPPPPPLSLSACSVWGAAPLRPHLQQGRAGLGLRARLLPLPRHGDDRRLRRREHHDRGGPDRRDRAHPALGGAARRDHRRDRHAASTRPSGGSHRARPLSQT